MKIQTKHFGEIEIEEDKIVKFFGGIFGFEKIREFVLLYEAKEEPEILTFAWLQAVEEPAVCLPLINPMLWFDNYEPDIDDEVIETLGELDRDALDVYSVVVVPEDITTMTTNLLAPVVINRATKKGAQVIVNNEGYQVKHNLYDKVTEKIEASKRAEQSKKGEDKC